MQDLAFAPALEQARLVREKEVSPVELVELYSKRISELNPKLDAYLTVVPELAMEAAREAEARLGSDDLPAFHGVPISIKDLDDTAGIRTTCGTKAWAERVPDRDGHVAARIKQAGFIILGKTNTPEFGKSVVCEPDGYPPCRNPWNPDHTPGGSSGGAASALAAGLCPVSQGSDGGGSIRTPAACCGVFGLKPSRGRISFTPAFPSLFGVHGPLARTVADAAALLDVMAGYETGDVFWAPAPERPFALQAAREPGRLRIAASTKPTNDLPVDPVALRSVEEAAELLTELGHDVVEADPDYGELPMMSHMALRAAGMVSHEQFPRPEELGDVARFLYEAGRNMGVADYMTALDEVQKQNRRVIAFFDDVDVLLTPTLSVRPPRVGELKELINNPDALTIAQKMSQTFLSIWNNTGQPAASVPFDIASDGLPVNIQLVGRPADDATLLRLSAQVEAARPWAQRRPPVS